MAEPRLTLGEEIDLGIVAGGPISLATYMGMCLTHPTKGYYRRATPLGAGGDFITAPEISQMFGEVIGAFIGDLYLQMGSPERFTLLELGPGRGTLAADALRVATRIPGLHDALTLALYETHPDLMAIQRKTLAAYAPVFLADPEEVSGAPLLIIANEFFDALPIRQFVRNGARWHERMVGLVEGKRAFGLSPMPMPADAIPGAYRNAGEGEVAEIGLAARQFMERLSRLIAPRGGAVLAIDYGYERSGPGDTLQAVSQHGFADPLTEPGMIDLSSHVDFETLGHAARMAGLNVWPLVTQGRFLTSLGVAHRAATLASNNPQQAEAIASARDRLIGEDQMGRLFKVLCAASPGLVPAGFPPSGA